MTQPAKAQEPSMEEILASIRRIIADDDAPASPRTATEPPPAAATAPRPSGPPPTPAAAPRPAPAPPLARPPEPVLAPAAGEAMYSAPASLGRAAEPAPDVFDLTEAMTASMPPLADGFRTTNGRSDLMFEDGDEDEDVPEAVAPEPRTPISQSIERALISSSTSAAVDSAFNSLAHTVLVQNARTLEDLVREMLRPMLKSWLDDNLPGLVERLVRAEIERVSRGKP
jgi:cell pole-organizing protein PopZ